MEIATQPHPAAAQPSAVAVSAPTSARLDGWRGAVLCLVILLCPVVYSFRFTSFLLPKELVLTLGLCLMAVLLALRGRWDLSGIRAFLPLWLLVLVSAAVPLALRPAQAPATAVVELVRVTTLLLAPALVFDLLRRPRWRRRVTAALLASALPVAALGLLQYARLIPFLLPEFPGYTQRAYSVFGNQDLFGGYLAIAAPIAVARLLRGRRADTLAVLGLPLLVAGLLVSGSRAAWVAACVGTAVLLPLAQRNPRRTALVAGLVLVTAAAATVAAPQATLGRFAGALRADDVGYRVRLWIWDGAARMIADHPVVGVGPGHFAYYSPWYMGEALQAANDPTRYHNDLHAVHAESEPIEILAETGVVGILLCGWMLARLVRRRGTEWGGLAALLTFSLLSFPFHSAPHALAGLLLGGTLLARIVKPLPRRTAWAAPLLAFGLAGLFAWTTLIPSYLLNAAQEAHVAKKPAAALYERALRWPWPNYEAHARYGFRLAEEGRFEEARRHLLRARQGYDVHDVYLALGAVDAYGGRPQTAPRWLRESLFRYPSDGSAWDLLISVAPEPERDALRREAARWSRP